MQKAAVGFVLFVIAVFVVGCKPAAQKGSENTSERFNTLMAQGQGYLQKGDATNAISAYEAAVKLGPESLDAELNLANAYLLAGRSSDVLTATRRALELDPNSAAAYYLQGCAYLRLNQPEPALQALQQSQKIDPAVTALDFQLGIAHERLGHVDDAIRQFETVLQFEPEHPSANYQLARLYQKAGRTAEANEAMARHQQILAKNPGQASGVAAFERSKYTEPRVAFTLEQPASTGISVKFTDVTAQAFGKDAALYRSPIAVLDYNHDGRNSLLVRGSEGMRLLDNQGGKFTPLGDPLPLATNAEYQCCLVGDINNDRFEDALVLGEQVSHAFRFATNGQAREVTSAAGLTGLKARNGLLADLDFTGRLDLLAIQPGGQGLRIYRNLGNFYFQENTSTSGLPANLPGLRGAAAEDWNNEDVPGVFLLRENSAPLFFPKQRAGSFVQTNLTDAWPAGSVIAMADFNNDLHPDMAIAGTNDITVMFGRNVPPIRIPLAGIPARRMLALDYDNDGWVDLVAIGKGVRVWRNAGKAGFVDMTQALGLDTSVDVSEILAADFDNDGDTDLVLASAKGLLLLRNDGGNENRQLKLRLTGNRSNASGLGVRMELTSGHWRTIHTVHQLPVEIGVGKNTKIDVLRTRWFDLATTLVDVPVNEPLELVELTLPTGSCPYLYAWDGHKFRFVTDILGASPLGLPVSETRYVEADPQEYLHLGSDETFPALNGRYEIRITEELREVLYLDQAKLVVVDHPAEVDVFSTSKMLPGKPFVPHELRAVKPLAHVRKATRSDGKDLTAEVAEIDRKMAGPVRIREPQLRGLAEPFSLTLDFGPLPVEQPLVLVLNGWLRFGGGMANIAGSIDPGLPFPFPRLEAELPDGSWKPIDVPFGVPAGKTKTILVDLQSALPAGARRLRVACAFELYWDAIWLGVKTSDVLGQTELSPISADMRWHGYGKFESLPPEQPLTPIYDSVDNSPQWRRTPYGWCTRYGPVSELLERADNAMALLNGGDEVALAFDAARIPPKPAGLKRDLFLFVVGWDKDADFHVGQGWRVEPLPHVGLRDQEYGRMESPSPLKADWADKYNTRWVGPLVLKPSNDAYGATPHKR